MKIAVTGYYGFSNYGDNLFILATKLGAEEFWKEDELLFISPPIKGIDANYIVPKWFPKKIYYNMGLPGKLSRMTFLILAILKSKAILNAGGSILSSGSSFSKFKIQLFMKKIFNKKIFGIGLSIGPFISKEDEKKAKDLIKNFDFLAIRDKASCKFIDKNNNKISCSTDLVAIIEKKYNFNKVVKNNKIIGVSLMDFKKGYKDTNGEYIDVDKSMKEIIKYSKDNDSYVRVFILNDHPLNGDREISEKFIVMLEESNIEYEVISIVQGSLEVWKNISECSMMFSYRLHGAITAYLSGVPFYLYEYHEKCTDFLKDIENKKDYKIYINESIKNFNMGK